MMVETPPKRLMQVLQAGDYKYILLELESGAVAAAAKQAGFESKIKDTDRSIHLDLTALDKNNPLLLFDASDPANLGWFSRCQFYIDGRTGGIMQTPMTLANKRDRSGRSQSYSVKVKINKELPATFRLPGRQPITEQVFYALFQNFLHALTRTGVAVCGSGLVQPLAGRTENFGPRN